MDANIERKKFNVCLLGETHVGKTSLAQSLIGKSFNENQVADKGIDYVIHKAIIDGKQILFKIYDIIGKESYNSISSSILKMADGFLLVFSVDNKKTLEKISNWIENIEENVNINEKVLILVGNKIDAGEREVTNEK